MMSKDEWKTLSQVMAVKSILDKPDISEWARSYWSNVYNQLLSE
jgi:hypothetical protein